MIAALLAAAESAAPATQALPPAQAIAWAIALLLLAALLAITEFLLVSWGMLLLASVVSAVAAVYLAFSASTVVGWLFVAAVPVLGVAVVRTGLALMRRNTAMVQRAEVTADAGYRHAAAAAGVGIGAVGELVTPATPTGRARFAGAHGPVELDVQVRGPVLARGDRVVVLSLDGPVIGVGAAPDTVSGLMTNPPDITKG
jgi:membrane-bound ClpP family serine protease